MKLSRLLPAWFFWTTALPLLSRADILIVPGPSIVQVRSGSWDPTRLTVRQALAAASSESPATTTGEVAYSPRTRGEWRARLALQGLRPDQTYSLALVAEQAGAGPSLPVAALAPTESVRRYEFLHFTTDENGSYRADVAVVLGAGSYRVALEVVDRLALRPVLERRDVAFRVE